MFSRREVDTIVRPGQFFWQPWPVLLTAMYKFISESHAHSHCHNVVWFQCLSLEKQFTSMCTTWACQKHHFSQTQLCLVAYQLKWSDIWKFYLITRNLTFSNPCGRRPHPFTLYHQAAKINFALHIFVLRGQYFTVHRNSKLTTAHTSGAI